MILKTYLSLFILFLASLPSWGSDVLIDPGHGGRDRGAEMNGLFEADIVWPWALSLKRELSRLGIQADLTRSEKSKYGILEKKSFLTDRKYNLIISLHANFFIDPKVKGVEYFIKNPLNLDDQKLRLAYEEQSDSQINTIVSDLERQGRLYLSLKMSQNLQKIWPGKIQQGSFEVLEIGHAPSVLIELGYLSNSLDLANLRDPKFIQVQSSRLAQAIKQSLVDVKVDVL